jgi:hypothetical protein
VLAALGSYDRWMPRSFLAKLASLRSDSASADVDHIEAAVAGRVEQAELHDDPFPHLEIDGLLPQKVFERLADGIPAPEYFKSIGKTKLDLDMVDADPYFAASPEETREVWSLVRDAVFRETIAPIVGRRLHDGLLAKYEFLFGPEIANELLARGVTSTDGRLQGRRPGYDLKPHLDSQHFGVTCLLYFSSSAAEGASGALCLFKPDRDPEVRDASTYYPAEEEGISAEVAKTIPIRENLLVAFLNTRNALHGVRVEKKEAVSDFVRFAYQCQILPKGFEIEEIYPRLGPEHQARWRRLIERGSAPPSM